MIKKSHAFALAVTTVGLIGFAAPMASAATTSFANGGGSGSSSVVNVSGNQVPVQVCGNDAYINGIGAQVPAEGDALVGSLLSPGAVTKDSSTDNRGCVMMNSQSGADNSAGSSVVNVANNQIPIQACGNDLYGNVIGAQVPLEGDSGTLALLSPAAITETKSTDNRGCALANGQSNW
jgi:hypothetical protein